MIKSSHKKIGAYFFVFFPPLLVLVFIVRFTNFLGLFQIYEGYEWFILLWIAGLALFLIELAYLIGYLIVTTICKPTILKEGKINEAKLTAIIYVVRNANESLINNIVTSMNGNQRENFHYWLLSDRTDDPRSLKFEKQIIAKSKNGLRFFSRNTGTGWKRGMISEWLQTDDGKKYDYLIVCDADTVLPPKTVKALLKKADAKDNSEIAIFQTLIASKNSKTHFGKWLHINQELTQRIYARASQSIFGQVMSFGSGNLIRAQIYRSILIPSNALSHDIWDTALLNTKGWKTAFCEDIVTLEDYPNNYISAIRREQRWLVGTLQSIPLLRLPNLSIGTRFQMLRSSYLYLIQPFILFWIFLGPLSISQAEEIYAKAISMGPVFYTPMTFGVTGGTAGSIMNIGLIPIWLGLVFILSWSRNLPSIGLSNLIWSTILFMNNVVYLSATVLMMPFINQWC